MSRLLEGGSTMPVSHYSTFQQQEKNMRLLDACSYACAVMLIGLLTFGDAVAQSAGQEANRNAALARAALGQPGRADIDLHIREILDKYYSDVRFYVGGASNSSAWLLPNNRARLEMFMTQFSYITPNNAFKQTDVYVMPGAEWMCEEYKAWIEIARNNNMVMRAHGPIGPQSSRWIKGLQAQGYRAGTRTPEELWHVLKHFMTNLSKDIEKNSDVIKWMDVVNETITGVPRGSYQPGDWFGPIEGAGFQNPWLMLGQDDSCDLRVPLYIIKAFELANAHAPSVKKLFNQNDYLEKPVWDKIKATVKFLRARGLQIDALGWQAHVPLGWEKKPENMAYLEYIIDWCRANDLEFHITELNVVRDPRLSPETQHEQAELYYALTSMLARKAVEGATVGLSFWDFVSTPPRSQFGGNRALPRGGLFDVGLSLQTPQYLAVKRALLDNVPKRDNGY